MGIRQQKKSQPIGTRYRGGKLDTSSGSSKLNSITNLMARPWDFGNTTYLLMGGKLDTRLSKLSNSPAAAHLITWE